MSAEQDFALPEGLSPKGLAAAKTVLTVLAKHNALHAGGCHVFWTPEDWTEKGVLYGRGAELIVVHDGGSHAPFFNHSYERYTLIEEMMEAVRAVGAYVSPCTCWYTAIYTREADVTDFTP